MSTSGSAVPASLRVQISRLFGSSSKFGKSETFTDKQYRVLLKKVLEHLWKYRNENVVTDEVHGLMLDSCFASAKESLDNHEDFWPGYCEGITRLALLVMGDYPDHRDERPGSRKKDHFDLSKMRTLTYRQDDPNQQFATLLAAYRVGVVSDSPFQALSEFREIYGFGVGLGKFIRWYKMTYPERYVKVF